MKMTKTKLNEELELVELDQHKHITFFENHQSSRRISVYLDEEIKEPKYYRPLIEVAESLTENDLLDIKVCTYGGSLDGALAIISCMNNTEAEVVVTLTGMAASAGSLICLAAPNLVIDKHANAMIHQASFSSGGTQSNIMSHVKFEDSRVKAVMKEVYEGFLTAEEMKEVFTGVEMWFTADEIMQRLAARDEYLLNKGVLDEGTEAVEPDKAKPKKSK